MVSRRKGRKTGKYRVRISVGGLKHEKSFTKLADAKRYQAKLERENELVRSGLGMPHEMIAILDYSRTWMKKRERLVLRSEITQPTYDGDEKNLRLYVLPFMGARPLQAVPAPEWAALLDFIQDKFALSNATRNRVRSTIQTMYSGACSDGVMQFNPIDSVPRLSEAKKKRPPAWWETEAECISYLEGAQAEGQGFALAATFLINTGARVGEAVVVRICDVELDRENETGIVTLARILEQSTGDIKPRTKGGVAVERHIPLTKELYQAIIARLATGKHTRPANYLICDARGEMLDPDRILAAHYRVCDQMKLKRITVHQLRTTFATLQRNKGVAKDNVQDFLGHSSAIVTNVYAKTSKQAMKHREIKGVGAPRAASDGVIELSRKKGGK